MMPTIRRARAGFTLVELIVALLLLVVVGGALYKMLVVTQRTTRTQSERSTMQGALRTGSQLAIAELQELYTNAAVGEAFITAMTPTQLDYRALRGYGLTCSVTNTSIRIRKAGWSGFQQPVLTRHRVLLFSDGDSAGIATDDAWIDMPINNVNASSTCPDGTAAWDLGIALPVPVAHIPIPGPVRTMEAMQLGLMTQGGRSWLGIRAVNVVGEQMTPLAGPLRANGLQFRYFANTATTVTPAQVTAIELWLFGETERGAQRGIGGATQLLQDSVRIRVNLRNSD